jgi:hypothetical protein
MKASLIALIAAGAFGQGDTTIVQPVLGTLVVTPSAGTLVAGSLTAGQVVGTISAKTAGSTVTENNPYIDVSGSNIVLTAAGAGLGASSVTASIVETLDGAIGSPRATDFQLVIQAAPVAAGTLNLQSVGRLTKSGVAANPINKLATGATITGGNLSGHWAIAGGFITVATAGDTADLPSGPYSLTIAGDPNYTTVVIPTEASKFTVTTVTELLAAITAAPLTTYSKIEIPDGVTLQPRLPTDTSQVDASFTLPNRAFTGVFTDPNYNKTYAEIAANPNAIATYTGGGYVEITCRTPRAGRIDQRMLFAGGANGMLFTNIAWIGTVFVTTQVGGAPTLLKDNTTYTGGTGYSGADTWTWNDPSSGAAMSGTFTVDGNGKILTAVITAKNAFVEDAVTYPIKLQNAATGNGIRTSTGTGGTLFLVHYNYVRGSPAGSDNFFQETNKIVNIEALQGASAYPSGQAEAIFRNCYFGGSLTKPGNANLWRNQHNFRWMRRIVIEDCTFHGVRNATGVNEAPEAVWRRNDIQQQLEDGIRVFSGGLKQHSGFTTYRAIIHDNAIHNNAYPVDFTSYHSDGIQIGSPNDGFDHYCIVFNNRIVFPNGSTQGIYNDDNYDTPNGTVIEEYNNLVICQAQDQRPVFRSYGAGDVIKNCTYLKGPEAVNTIGHFPIRGTSVGATITNTVYGDVSDQTYYPYGGYTITAAGTGFTTSDKITYTDGFGQFGYGHFEVNSSGGVTRIIWDRTPAGVVGGGLFMDTTVLDKNGNFVWLSVLSKFPAAPNEGRFATRQVYSNAGRGLKVTVLPDKTAYTAPGSFTPQNGTIPLTNGLGSVVVVNSRPIRSYASNTGGGTSWEECFVGPFTRFDGTVTDYSKVPPAAVPAKGWNFVVDSTNRATLFATVDAIFTPKVGSYVAGTGHTIPV